MSKGKSPSLNNYPCFLKKLHVKKYNMQDSMQYNMQTVEHRSRVSLGLLGLVFGQRSTVPVPYFLFLLIFIPPPPPTEPLSLEPSELHLTPSQLPLRLSQLPLWPSQLPPSLLVIVPCLVAAPLPPN